MTSAERKAVAFFALLAAAGAGARVLGIGDPPGVRAPTAADRLALQHQLAAVDSAHAAKERGRAGKRSAKGVGRRTGRRRSADSTAGPPTATAGQPDPRRPAPEPRGPVDVNQADTAALDALPGIGPALARRIVADRVARGAYGSMAELSRVPGIGAALERRLVGAVTFTGGGRPSSGSAPAPGGARRGAPAGWPPR